MMGEGEVPDAKAFEHLSRRFEMFEGDFEALQERYDDMKDVLLSIRGATTNTAILDLIDQTINR
jgi:hypothetical protein